MYLRLAFAACAIFGFLTISDGRAAEISAPTPGDIKLLSGYKHEKEHGIDTRVGKIWKEGGLIIHYDIGKLAGNAVKQQQKDDLQWYKEQVVEGRTVQLALTKDRMFYVTFPETSANFYGKAPSDDEVADMLLMVLSYAPLAKPK